MSETNQFFMKLYYTVYLLFISIVSFGQNEKSFRTFISTSSGFSYHNDFSQSFEIGRWGNTSPLSYSVLFFETTNTILGNGWQYFIGIKPYYTFAQPKNSRFSFMGYILPELRINKKNLFQIEEGLVMNYQIDHNFILSYTFSIQHSAETNGSPGLSICLNYLFN